MNPTPSPNLIRLVADSGGFLPSRGSFMLDFVVVAMALIVVVMAYSVWIVRVRRDYLRHKRIQIVTALALLVTVVAFEIDVRFLTSWKSLAADSRFAGTGVIEGAMYVHLSFAIPTPFLWAFTILQALRRFPDPPAPTDPVFSRRHRFWGWVSVVMMTMTAVTGWIFYYVAFVA